MKKLKIAEGKWSTRLTYDIYAAGYYVGTTRNSQGNAIDADNAELIADAGTTYHATQMLPSEMAHRIKALEHKLEVFDQLEAYGCTSAKIWLDAVERINALEDGLRKFVHHMDNHRYNESLDGIADNARALLNPINEAHGHLLTKPE